MSELNSSPTPQRVMLQIELLPCVNQAMVDNRVVLCNRRDIVNDTDRQLQDVSVSVTGEHVETCTVTVAQLPPFWTVQLGGLDVKFRQSAFVGIKQPVDTVVNIVAQSGDQEIARSVCTVTLLPDNFWGGLQSMPSTLATLVIPTSSAVATVLQMASPILEQLTGDHIFDNYQTLDPNRAKAQMQAIYCAMQQLELTVMPMTRDFMNVRDRVRTPHEVLQERMSNCLELSLFMASCLEACHLNPLLVFMRSHVMVGMWLVDSYNINPVSDDSALLNKASNEDLSEMALIDVTACTETEQVSFDQACRRTVVLLRDTHQAFNCFIDIKSCRLQNIMPSRVLTTAEPTDAALVQELVLAPAHSMDAAIGNNVTAPAQITKQQIWERKLLDFSMRNNLLNMRIGRRVLPFISFAIDKLENRICKGLEFGIYPAPVPIQIQPDENGMFDSAILQDSWRRLVISELGSRRLRSYLNEKEMINVLKHIHRASRTALEENGANSLFLTLGMLKWYETDRSTKPRFAPILMIPVDLVRHAGNRYVIRSRDEETIINVTLIEMIKQQFQLPMDGLTPLPTNDNGVDVRQVLAIMRSCIMERPRWDVLDEAMLGLFSFSKFVMWNDIHNNAYQLAQHPVIQALAGNKKVHMADAGLPPADARELDQTALPEEFAMPVDVDSSQFEAIVDSGRGKSFVLHGPPGTGKSQTITNIIANALFQGKSVLFVAEKMAALEVVQKRLKAIGIDPFCLELHSNKTTKRHVLDQLEKALNVTERSESREYQPTSLRLSQERETLSHYVLAMHSPRPSGISLYECITRYLDIEYDEIQENAGDGQLTTDEITRGEELILSLEPVVKLTGKPVEHPLHGLVFNELSAEQLPDIATKFVQLNRQLAAMRRHTKHIDELIGVNLGTRLSDYRTLALLCRGLAGINRITPMMVDSYLQSDMQQLRTRLSQGNTRRQNKLVVDSIFHPSAYALDASQLLLQWREAGESWLLPRFMARRKLTKQLKPYMNGKQSGTEQSLESLEAFQMADAVCDQAWQNEVNAAFAQVLDKDQTDWQQLEQELERVTSLLTELRNNIAVEQYNLIVERLKAVAQADPYLFGKNATLWTQVVNDCESMQSKKTEIEAICTLDDSDSDSFEQWVERVSEHIEAMGREWKVWTDRRQELLQKHLPQVVERIEQGEPVKQVAEAWKKGVYHAMATYTLGTDQMLSTFSGLLFEDVIAKFRKLDHKFQELTKVELFNRLTRNLRKNYLSPELSTQLTYLRRVIANRGRAQSVRNIMDQLGGLLHYLTPCMLMSPISVAQYLSLSQRPFDIVIFDEASQMPTSEAIGAIARGKALIVVGDPKQMPPTNFFNANQVDESEEAFDDLDSVLDDTIALDFPNKHLRWHYRSRHESLIAFSNSQYYDGRLITFPSVDDRDTKVKFVPVQGTYDYGRSRSNKAEAQAIVSEVLRRLCDKQLQKLSLGIVAFSISQQNLIDDMLMDALALRPELEQLATQCEEPIFIKNLENVQGDERDVILFSIGYGPDVHGKVSMNFGPLNNTGGERRLNVAVSRARYEMMVFSTLMPEQIDLNRSKSLGVQGLKMFLEFARDGRISYQTNVPTATVNIMARQLAQILQSKGYQVATAIGRSKFKIDLAVVDTTDPDRYMLGVLCDGKGYSDTKTVRDREVCQPNVLSMLGWNILRVWMVDWFYNRDRVVQQVLDALSQIKEANHRQPVAKTSAKTGKPAVRKAPVFKPVSEPVPKLLLRPDSDPEPDLEPEPIIIPIPTRVPAPKPAPKAAKKTELKKPEPKPNDAKIKFGEEPYSEADIPVEAKGGVPIMTTRPTKTMAQMRQILQSEQPITFHYACKRMCRIWGVRSISERVTRYMTWLLKQTATPDPSSTEAVPFYWDNANRRLTYGGYRIKNGREWNDIPLIEIKNAIITQLKQHQTISDDEMPAMIVTLFGIKKCVSMFREQVSIALSELVRDKRILHGEGKFAACRKPANNHKPQVQPDNHAAD